MILHKPDKIISKVSDSSLFDHLDTVWEFQPGPTPTTCWLSFKTDFMFKSPLYGQIASVFFDEVRGRLADIVWVNDGSVQSICSGVAGPRLSTV